MSKPSEQSAAWDEANRLLGALAASVGGGKEARLGFVADPEDWRERAAIMEYDGGLPREAAERFAREFAALGPEPAPEALAALDKQLQAIDARRSSFSAKKAAWS